MIRATSRKVYQKIVNDMAPGLRRKICETLLYGNANLTSSEIAQRLGCPRDSISPRMKELIDRGLVEERGTRDCTVTGQSKITYWLTGQPEQKPTDTKVKKPTKKQIEKMFQKIKAVRMDTAGSGGFLGSAQYYLGVQRALGWVLGRYDVTPDDVTVVAKEIS